MAISAPRRPVLPVSAPVQPRVPGFTVAAAPAVGSIMKGSASSLQEQANPAATPPPGTYDPVLEAQRTQADAGLADNAQDYATANTRDTVNYELQRGDLLTQQQRGLTDLGAAHDRGVEDYNRNIAALTQNYSRLAGRQRQQDAAYGVAQGGAALQAAAKRAANMAGDRSPIEAGQQRFLTDNAQSQERLTTDSNDALARLALVGAPPGAEGGPLGGTAFQDRTLAMLRGQRDAANTGLNISQEEAYQAAQAGWNPDHLARAGGASAASLKRATAFLASSRPKRKVA